MRQQIRVVKWVALVLTVAVGALAMGVLGGTKAQEAERPTLDGPNVARYDHGDEQLDDSTYRVVQGTEFRDGCRMPYGELRLAPGERAIYSREIEFDPDTCRSVIEIGVPSEAMIEGWEELDEAQQASEEILDSSSVSYSWKAGDRAVSTAPLLSNSDDDAQGLFTITSQGYARSWFHDPCPYPCITVNSVKNTINWDFVPPPSSGCAYGNWFQPQATWWHWSGWQLDDSAAMSFNPCAYYQGWSAADFSNPYFCTGGYPPDTTFTLHDVTVSGASNGELASYVFANKWGGCHSLLSHKQVLVQE